MLNDRSASRQEEERQYEGYSTAPAIDEPLIALSQWRWVKGLLPDRDRTPSVLDVGCGHGAFLRVVHKDGGRVAGLELDPAGVETCRRLGLPVVQGSIFDVGVPAGPWDVITLWEVLEHLEHPREALSLVVSQLAPGGLLVLRGRNARLHAPFKSGYARMRGLAARLRLPDVSCIHRWGFGPAGYSSLLDALGIGEVRLYPGVPTPGDRSAALGSLRVASAVKGVIRATSLALYRVSFKRLYPFPSVLITGRKPH